MLIGLSISSWIFVVWSATNMDSPVVKLMMPMNYAWSLEEAVLVWMMWAVMMGAMMLPSAAPMIMTYQRLARKDGGSSTSGLFAFAYIVVWLGFSTIASILQWELQALGALSSMLVLNEGWIAGCVMITAGVVQWTPLKDICLKKCRTPIGFLVTEWRPGRRGEFVMGLRHGAFCIGCCWALMALLFVFGVMNLIAIIGLAMLVAIEKLLPWGDRLGKIGGLVMIIWGGRILAV